MNKIDEGIGGGGLAREDGLGDGLFEMESLSRPGSGIEKIDVSLFAPGVLRNAGAEESLDKICEASSADIC